MISACPEAWPANQDDEVLREVDEKCSNGSDTLPPVTDLDDGVLRCLSPGGEHTAMGIQVWLFTMPQG